MYKYFIPFYGLIYPYWAKDKLLNDMGDDLLKLGWVFFHLFTTVPLSVGIIFYFIIL